MQNQVIRKEMKISGRVQGVGFRYRAQHAASQLRLTGWVRNEWDGTVRMEVQGTDAEIDTLLKIIRMGTYVEIDRVEDKQIPIDEAERGFHVR